MSTRLLIHSFNVVVVVEHMPRHQKVFFRLTVNFSFCNFVIQFVRFSPIHFAVFLSTVAWILLIGFLTFKKKGVSVVYCIWFGFRASL